MIKLSNTKLLSIITRLLILVLIAKSLSLVLMWILPSDGVSLNIKQNYQPKYQRVDFKNILESASKKEKIAVVKTSNGISITNMILKGLYGTANSGFVIVSLKSNPDKTTILSVGEIFSGYTLKSIASDSAMFTKGENTFTLHLLNTEQKGSSQNIFATKNNAAVNDPNEPITQQVVTRQDIAYYAKNPKQIWKEISIHEVKTKDKKGIKGFKISRIDPKSKFATMGLKKGDLIIKANNVKLKSYRDALDLYTKIDKIDVIQIVILRNGIEKEIVYEIN